MSFAIFIFSSDRLPRAKVFKGYANVGVTDTSKNVSKANQLKFTNSDVIFYPDNKNPGKFWRPIGPRGPWVPLGIWF